MSKVSRQDRLSDPEAWKVLKRLYDERCPEDMSQEQFGLAYGIGTQGMVWQYLNGYTPLTVEACARFAKGLDCTIQDISPLLANALSKDIFPYLGKTLRRVALLVLALQFGGQPLDANANHGVVLHKNSSQYTFSDFANAIKGLLFRLSKLLGYPVLN